MGLRGMIWGVLFVEEGSALDDVVDEGAQAAMI
jgi:hypothetical protein